MSARDVIAQTPDQNQWGKIGTNNADAILAALRAAGWVVGRVPPREGAGAGGQTDWQMGFNACRAAFFASGEGSL